MQSKFEGIEYIIIDEMSMVGLNMLYVLHLRLNEIMAVNDPDVIFGGKNVILIGDFAQLSPVRDESLYIT